MSRVFANPLTELAEFEQLQECLKKKKGPVQVSGCLDSQKVHLMQETVADRPWKLVVTYDDARAREIYDDFGCFRDNVWLYPAKDLLFYSADIHGNLLTRERLQVLRHLMEDQNGVVVTTMDGLMDHLLPLRCMQEQVLHLETGQELFLGNCRLVILSEPAASERTAEVVDYLLSDHELRPGTPLYLTVGEAAELLESPELPAEQLSEMMRSAAEAGLCPDSTLLTVVRSLESLGSMAALGRIEAGEAGEVQASGAVLLGPGCKFCGKFSKFSDLRIFF